MTDYLKLADFINNIKIHFMTFYSLINNKIAYKYLIFKVKKFQLFTKVAR